VFAAAFYAYGAVVLFRLPALADSWGDGGGVAVVGAWAVLYAAAVGLARVARAPQRRGLGRFDRRLRANAAAVVGLSVVLGIVCVATLAPILGTTDPAETLDPAQTRYQGPSSEHPMGTDKLGRDVWSRVLYGARTSLGVAFAAVLLAALFGVAYGAVAGFAGRRLDDAMMRVVDGLLAFPRLVFVLTLVALFPNSLALLIFAIAATGWMGVARLVRGEILRLKDRDFVQAAVATGLGRGRLVARHLLPNAAGPVIVSTTLSVGGVILLESYLSFLGLGVQPPLPSWGGMVFDGREMLLDAWWVAAFPALAITVVVVAFNLLGDGLRDAMETR
jgi:ABC-type dipeptide/oligopeptide/nickel transport system permease subunit